MMKKKASRMISPPARYRKELQIPRSRDDGGGGYGRFRGDLIGYLGFLHRVQDHKQHRHDRINKTKPLISLT